MAEHTLVTGASGFIGAHVAAALLREGHEVSATVSRPSRVDDLRASLDGLLPGSGADVRVVVADLNSDDGWAEAATGCDGIAHVASPVPVSQPKDPNELIRPARDGTLRVIRAARAADVGRVVLTSSVAAIAGSRNEGPERVYTEADWTDLSVSSVTPYNRSKTLAERAARDDVADNGGPELVTVNPGMVLGPLARPELNTTVEFVHRLLQGDFPMVPHIGFDTVDVRDVADLHVKALTTPGVDGGRFPAVSEFLWFEEMAMALKDGLGDAASKVKTRRAPNLLVKVMSRFEAGIKTVLPELDQRRSVDASVSVNTLDWHPRPAREAVVSRGQSILDHGLGPTDS